MNALRNKPIKTKIKINKLDVNASSSSAAIKARLNLDKAKFFLAKSLIKDETTIVRTMKEQKFKRNRIDVSCC